MSIRAARKTVILFLAIFVVGCTDDLSLPAGSTSSDSPTGVVNKANEVSLLDPIPISDLLLLPMPLSRERKELVDTTVMVTRKAGGRLTAQYSYMSLLGRRVFVNATLTIPPEAVKRDVAITMAIDTLAVGVLFKPEGLLFGKTVYLDYSVSGLDPISALFARLGFYYVNLTGPSEAIRSKSLSVDLLKGRIVMTDAQLRHFSQYAFGRRM
jgi:hypothetical protein